MNDRDTLTIGKAIFTRSRVVADYTDRFGNDTTRQLLPERADRHGVIGVCDLRGDYRRFNAKRLSNVRICDAQGTDVA